MKTLNPLKFIPAAAALLQRIRLPQPTGSSRAEFGNIAEGTADCGNKSYLADAALTPRYQLVIIGSDANHIAASSANTDIPLGIATDEAAAAEDLLNVSVLGAAKGTQRVVLGGTIVVGDLLQSNGDGTAIKLKATTGTWYIIGRALQAGASGDTIEFAPTFPLQRVVA